MATIKASKFIAAKPEDVFAACADLRNAAGRVKAIKKIEVLTDGPIGVGTRFRETRMMFGREATETMEVSDFQPPRTYSVGCESCGARYLSRFDFHPDRDGTRVDIEFNCTPISFMAKLMSPLSFLMAGMMRKCLEGDLSDIKTSLESRPPAR